MIELQFREYKYIHEIGSKSELILYWAHNTAAIIFKEANLLLSSQKWIANEIFMTGIIVRGDHSQDSFRFAMKIVFIIKYGKLHARISNVVYILYKNDNGIILEETIIEKP